MEIATKIKPLFEELLKIHFQNFLTDDDFTRLCNRQDITEEYTTAYNEGIEIAKKSNFDFFITGMINRVDLLANLLNKIYANKQTQFPSIVAEWITGYLKLTKRYISIDQVLNDLLSLGLSSEDKNKTIQAWAKYDSNNLLKVELLRQYMIGRAANDFYDESEFKEIRKSLIRNTTLKQRLPSFVIDYDNLDEFFRYSQRLGGYRERRAFIYNEFLPVMKLLGEHDSTIAQAIVIDNIYVLNVWHKALDRMSTDPEGAITSARTLLETVCKHILDTSGQIYDHGADLPVLYKSTASILNLSPDQHTKEIFKQILSGCFSVVSGLGGIRNKISDAHAISETRAKPSSRHAALAVNLSG